MLFYWGLWLFFLILSFVWIQKYYKQSYISLLFLIFVLAVITGGREDVGSDWDSYNTYYTTGVAFDKASGHMEFIFETIRNLCFKMGLSYGMFCFVITLLSLFVFWYALLLLGVENCFLAFLVYLSFFFCNYQFNIVRHGLLASFIILGLAYLSLGNRRNSFLCVIIGSGFHIMGIIFVPLFFFLDKIVSRKVFLIVVGVSFVVLFADLSGRIVAAFPFLSLIDRVEGYVDADNNEVYKLSIGTIGFLAIAVYSIIFRRNDYEELPAFRIMANTVALGFVVFCFLNAFSAIVQRVGNLLNLGVIFLLPYLWYYIYNDKMKMVARVLIIIYLALYYPKSWNVEDDKGNYSMLPFKTDITNLL